MMLPTQMQAMEITDGALVPVRVPLPLVGAGEVLIRVAYVGINRADVMQRAGSYPPPEGASPLPGLEVSGHIAAVGAGVAGWPVGMPVCALLAGGGYADYAVAPAGQVLRLPEGVDLAHAACLPEAAATSLMALKWEARLAAGERVLIHGGTSGLGLLMVQIACSWGAEVYATVGSDEKVALLTEMDIHAINHARAPFAEQLMKRTNGEGVDVIIDTLGAPHLNDHLGLLRSEGRMVTLAMMAGSRADHVQIGRMLSRRLRWSGTTLRSRTLAEKAAIMAEVAAEVWPHLASGRISALISNVFPLVEAEKALSSLQERLHLGKILLEVAA